MPLRFHEIVESRHQILNPFTLQKLIQLGDICDVAPGMTHLDLACGKGEMLCQWAQRYETRGVGIDLSAVFLTAAQQRAEELRVQEQVSFRLGDGGDYLRSTTDVFQVVSCVGATWIGGGLAPTLELMKNRMRDASSLVLVGEPFWLEPPPEHAFIEQIGSKDEFATLDGTLDRFEAAGLDLVEMVMASHDECDRYEASQWKAGIDWLRDNAHDPDAVQLRKWIEDNRRAYLKYIRLYLGWGVFVLRRG